MTPNGGDADDHLAPPDTPASDGDTAEAETTPDAEAVAPSATPRRPPDASVLAVTVALLVAIIGGSLALVARGQQNSRVSVTRGATSPALPGSRLLPTPTAPPPPTPTPPLSTPTPLPPAPPLNPSSLSLPTGQWTKIAGYSGFLNPPMLAPSDPRVAYRFDPSAAGGPLFATEDSGSSWRSLPLPAKIPESPTAVQFRIHPGDAQTVLAQFDVALAADACSRIGGSSAAPTDIAILQGCHVPFITHDAGQSWQPITLPLAGIFLAHADWTPGYVGGLQVPADMDLLHVAGSRLYASIFPVGVSAPTSGTMGGLEVEPIRLIASDDGGATWRLVDESLHAQQPCIGHVGVAPASETLYAAGACDYMRPRIWVSTDKGKTWASTDLLPDMVGDFGNATNSPNYFVLTPDGSPLVIGPHRHQFVTAGRPQVYLSTVGGSGWNTLPKDGLPGELDPHDIAIGPRSDGSIVLLYAPRPATVQIGQSVCTACGNVFIAAYSWRRDGTGWKRVTTALDLGPHEQINPVNGLAYALTSSSDVCVVVADRPTETLGPPRYPTYTTLCYRP